MKEIIDIEQSIYESILEYPNVSGLRITQLEYAILHGTPVPDNAQACDIEAIVKEIEEIYEQEKDIDSSWAAGLKHSLGIIRSHTKEGIINARNND